MTNAYWHNYDYNFDIYLFNIYCIIFLGPACSNRFRTLKLRIMSQLFYQWAITSFHVIDQNAIWIFLGIEKKLWWRFVIFCSNVPKKISFKKIEISEKRNLNINQKDHKINRLQYNCRSLIIGEWWIIIFNFNNCVLLAPKVVT